MRLYSRGQVIIISSASVILIFALAIGLGFFRLPFEDAENSLEPIEVSGSLENRTFELQTNPAPQGKVIPVSNSDLLGEDELDNINVYQGANEAVVNISTETLRFNWFLEPVPSEGGSGSGSIIDSRGYVLTNFHVVEDAYKVYVNLYDGSQYEGEVIGKDRENDLAVVKFNPEGVELSTISFGTSNDLLIGQKVLAIGNPFGYDRTLTTGVISGVGRPVKTSGNLIINNMIQTDASINPGNSGGPLLNSRGEMIGINTMIYSPTGGSVGIGFAVPVDTAIKVVPELIDHGMVIRGWIDVVPVQLDANIVRYARISQTTGLLVSTVERSGKAAAAGLRGGDSSQPVRYGRNTIYLGGDIIVAINGSEIASFSDFFNTLQDTKPGDIARVTVVRGKRRLELNVELSERPEGLDWE
ncbi:MAG: trypsin-like peptidase domain-containing protein [Spirochaetales bacterium]|nr:trypsin-like peptidase domain-containing protein [Spirochaetales bacterium]